MLFHFLSSRSTAQTPVHCFDVSYRKVSFRLPEFVFVPSCSRVRSLVLCLFFSWTSAGLLPAQTKPLTVSAIFTDPGFTADAPGGMEWSPDGARMTYLNGDGDLMSVDGDSGKASVLVPKEKIGSMHSKMASEQDK